MLAWTRHVPGPLARAPHQYHGRQDSPSTRMSLTHVHTYRTAPHRTEMTCSTARRAQTSSIITNVDETRWLGLWREHRTTTRTDRQTVCTDGPKQPPSHRIDVACSTARHVYIMPNANGMALEHIQTIIPTQSTSDTPKPTHTHHVRNNYGYRLRLSSQRIDTRRHLLCILALQARF
jgi:hypothetical protein